jgi:hypothetical protein
MAQALDVMKDMAKGKVSAEDGMKQLQSLVIDAAKAQMSLGAGASATASAGATGYSSKDSFESAPAAKPAVDLLGAAAGGAKPAAAQDPSFLENSGGGAKRGIASSTN